VRQLAIFNSICSLLRIFIYGLYSKILVLTLQSLWTILACSIIFGLFWQLNSSIIEFLTAFENSSRVYR